MIQPLSDEQILELHKQWVSTGDLKYRNTIVEGMITRVERWASIGMRTNKDDLVSAGMIGLLRGLDNSLKSSNENLIPYLCLYVRGARNRCIESIEGLGTRGMSCRKGFHVVSIREDDSVLNESDYWDEDEFKVKYNLTDVQFRIVKLLSEKRTQNEVFKILCDEGYTSFDGYKFTRANLPQIIDMIRKKISCVNS